MSNSSSERTMVITGSSSGFGRVTALDLARHGWRVFATVRKETDAEDLLAEAAKLGAKEQIMPLICDITIPEQVARLGEAVAAATPTLNALLNNAGTAYAGPLELLSPADLREQLEINVVAHLAVTQVLLPLLKAAHGTIINVSSVNGRIATPVVGAYSASKFALEGLSDALRVELAPFGVRVVLIEPSASGTNIWETSLQHALGKMGQYRNGPYKRLFDVTEKVARRASAGRGGFPPQLFAETVRKILDSLRPRARYVIPRSANREIVLRRLLPDRTWDWLVRRTLKW
jgi:NAD(P)-dependent dehydrogenase (short-subunit alcohol dehydrogenase family)